MDSIFGIGIPELVIILIIAGLILGPQRIRQVAYTMGRITAQLQRVSREFTRQLNAELDSLEDGSIRDSMNDVRQLRKEVEDLRRELASAPKSLQVAGKKFTQETEKSLRDAAQVADTPAVESPQEEPAQPVEQAVEDSPPEPTPPPPPLPKAVDVPGDPDQ